MERTQKIVDTACGEPMSKFDFTWALRYLWSGQKVRRAYWKRDDMWYEMQDAVLVLHRKGYMCMVDLIPECHVFANDWELIEEKQNVN